MEGDHHFHRMNPSNRSRLEMHEVLRQARNGLAEVGPRRNERRFFRMESEHKRDGGPANEWPLYIWISEEYMIPRSRKEVLNSDTPQRRVLSEALCLNRATLASVVQRYLQRQGNQKVKVRIVDDAADVAGGAGGGVGADGIYQQPGAGFVQVEGHEVQLHLPPPEPDLAPEPQHTLDPALDPKHGAVHGRAAHGRAMAPGGTGPVAAAPGGPGGHHVRGAFGLVQQGRSPQGRAMASGGTGRVLAPGSPPSPKGSPRGKTTTRPTTPVPPARTGTVVDMSGAGGSGSSHRGRTDVEANSTLEGTESGSSESNSTLTGLESMPASASNTAKWTGAGRPPYSADVSDTTMVLSNLSTDGFPEAGTTPHEVPTNSLSVLNLKLDVQLPDDTDGATGTFPVVTDGSV
jgi:hypothetical protein